MPDTYEKTAPSLTPFGHPLTMGILLMILTIILIGCSMMFSGNLLGLLVAAVGGAMMAFGLVKHSNSKPREAGLVTFAGSPIHIGGDTVVVGGTTILFPYLGISTIKVSMDNKDHDFDMTILSYAKPGKKPVPITGKISVTMHPDPDDLEDYIQAGNDMDEIFKQLHDLVYQETQRIVLDGLMDVLAISQRGVVISKALELRINNNLFQRKRFGLKLVNVRANFPLPEAIQKQMIDAGKEEYDRSAEHAEYRTMNSAAAEYQRELAKQYIPNGFSLNRKQLQHEIGKLVRAKKIPNLDECSERIRTQRLVRDGMVGRIEGSGGTVNVMNTGIDLGKKKKDK